MAESSELRQPERGQRDPMASWLRRIGRDLVIAMYGSTRAIRLYPAEHTAVKKSLAELCEICAEILQREQALELRISGEFLFVNSTRLRLDLTNYASFGYLLRMCRASGVGCIRVEENASAQDWLVLLSALDSRESGEPDDLLERLTARLAQAGITALAVGSPAEEGRSGDAAEDIRQAATRTYSRSVAVTRDVINSVRLGRAPSIRRIRRVVQGIVDQILNEETSLIGLTTLRDYDEYTFTHSVNVCIFAVALGRRMGMSKPQLFDLGLSALLHDIGKSRVPLGYLQKSENLTDQEWRQIAAHPWLGVLVLLQLEGQQEEVAYRAMTVAYEHHMRGDMSGYPRTVRPRAMSMTSRIVAVADGYDAATSRRAYQNEPFPPSAVLQEMRDNPRRGMDPVVVKAFINLLGIYPVGTLVVLDTFELAVVTAANPVPDALSRPIVTIVSDAHGNMMAPPIQADLAVPDASGEYPRTIIKTADPKRYGINVGDYFTHSA